MLQFFTMNNGKEKQLEYNEMFVLTQWKVLWSINTYM